MYDEVEYEMHIKKLEVITFAPKATNKIQIATTKMTTANLALGPKDSVHAL